LYISNLFFFSKLYFQLGPSQAKFLAPSMRLIFTLEELDSLWLVFKLHRAVPIDGNGNSFSTGYFVVFIYRMKLLQQYACNAIVW